MTPLRAENNILGHTGESAMKQAQIIKFLAAEFGATDVAELNKLLRQKDAPKTKYRLSGENLGNGVTGLIKMITADGLKVIGGTRTILVRFEDISEINKAKDRSERPVYTTPKKPKVAPKTKPASKTDVEEALEDDEEDDGDYSDLMPVVAVKPAKRRRPTAPVGKAGSKFIPKEKK